MNNYQLLSCVPITSNNNKNVLKNTDSTESFINQHGDLYINPSLVFLSQETTQNLYYSPTSPPTKVWNSGQITTLTNTFINLSVSNEMILAISNSSEIFYISKYKSASPSIIMHTNSGIPRDKLGSAKISFDGYTGDAVILDDDGKVWYANIASDLYKSTCKWTKFPTATYQNSYYYFSSISLSNKKIYATQNGSWPGSNIWYRADLSPDTKWLIAYNTSNGYFVSYDGYSNPPLLVASLKRAWWNNAGAWDSASDIHAASVNIEPTSEESYHTKIPEWNLMGRNRFNAVTSNGEIYAWGGDGIIWHKRYYDSNVDNGWVKINANSTTVTPIHISYDGGSNYTPGTTPVVTTPPPTTAPPTTPPPPTTAPPTDAPSTVPDLSNLPVTIAPTITTLTTSTPVATSQWIKGINNTYVMLIGGIVLLIILFMILKK